MITNPTPLNSFELDAELFQHLGDYRAMRKFNPSKYVELKARCLNHYLKKHNLKGCVIGVSGGVDSALALAIACYAQKMQGSCLETLLPVFMPVFNESASYQESAKLKSLELVNSLGLSLVELDLTAHHESLSSLVESVTSLGKTAWSRGQFVAHTRTPSLYYCATLLSAHGKPAVILGTTNKDEGHYLGYVGKASDGLVDVQLISDLHKSEVFAAACYLGVPESIGNATPNGDLFDGKSDEEMFGASYDFVELYHYLKQLNELGKEMPVCPGYEKMASNLEALHSYNRHKYLSCSPAVHLDILPDFCRYAQTWRTNLNFAKDSYYPQPTLRLDRIRGFEDSCLGLAVFKNSRLSAQDWMYPKHGYLVSDCSELNEEGEYAYAWVKSCAPSEIDGAAFEKGPLPVDNESWPLGRKALIVPLNALTLDFGIDL